MTEITVPLADLDQWQAFAQANEETLLELYPSIAAALKAACDGGLVIGGGATPCVHVYFADEE